MLLFLGFGLLFFLFFLGLSLLFLLDFLLLLELVLLVQKGAKDALAFVTSGLRTGLGLVFLFLLLLFLLPLLFLFLCWSSLGLGRLGCDSSCRSSKSGWLG